MNAVLAITDKCNMRCKMCDIGRHCHGAGGLSTNWIHHTEITPTDWEMRLIELGVHSVHIQGVEPLLYENISDLLGRLSRSMPVDLTTNGWFLQQYAADVGSCCRCLAVSLDGSNADIHDKVRGVHGSFDRAMAGIESIQSIWPNVHIRLSFAITPDNYTDISSYYELFCIKMGIEVVFNHYNYIHPLSCEGYDCFPANLSVYNLDDIDVKELAFQINECSSRCSFFPNIRSMTQLSQYYHNPPVKVLSKKSCHVMQQTLLKQRCSLVADGTQIIAGRCWLDSVFNKLSWDERRDKAAHILSEGLPPPCQRLCCAGKTV